MKPSLKRFSFSAMGSQCEVQFFDESRILAKKLARKLVAEAERLEQKYSRFRKDSFVAQINRAGGDPQGIAIDTETKSLFDHANSCFVESSGLFDITSGHLSRLWDFKTGIPPSDSEINNALKHTGFEKLRWSDSHLHVPAGMEIDFGGIVKEYAADSLAQLARSLGCQSGLLNMGGDFAVIGPVPESDAWPIGISDPDNPSAVMATITLAQGGLASSGDYERFFLHNGVRYSHILNPKTGWPSSGLRAVSVASNLCTVAGSMATIAMLKEENAALEWLEESGLPFVFMKQDGSIGSPAMPA
ncbi:MAG: FAD:protein FMN transferase [Pseudohongiellaceae bacterium]